MFFFYSKPHHHIIITLFIVKWDYVTIFTLIPILFYPATEKVVGINLEIYINKIIIIKVMKL